MAASQQHVPKAKTASCTECETGKCVGTKYIVQEIHTIQVGLNGKVALGKLRRLGVKKEED